jgi:hypothetical protein
MATYIVYFEQVNRTCISVDAEDEREAVRLSIQKWKERNTPYIEEINIDE